jgi:hypothetical protein
LVCNLCRTDAFLHFDMLVSSCFLQLNVMILITVFSSLIGALCLLKQGSFYYRYKMGHSDVIDNNIVDHLKATDLPWLRSEALVCPPCSL